MIINLHNKKITLTDWKTNRNYNKFRYTRYDAINRNNYISLIQTKLIAFDEYREWQAQFRGNLYILRDIYNKFYEKPVSFDIKQIEEAKNHIDKFLMQASNLAAFL